MAQSGWSNAQSGVEAGALVSTPEPRPAHGSRIWLEDLNSFPLNGLLKDLRREFFGAGHNPDVYGQEGSARSLNEQEMIACALADRETLTQAFQRHRLAMRLAFSGRPVMNVRTQTEEKIVERAKDMAYNRWQLVLR